MNGARRGNFFEDFRVGQRLVHATPRTLTEGDAALYVALTGARQPLHCARPFAHALGYRDLVLDDLLVFNTAFGKTVPDISQNAVANLGYADVRFLAPCHPGDTLRAQSEVIGVKENSNRRTGVVWVRSTALNQDGHPVLTWIRWVMVKKHDPASPAPAAVVPELPAHVAAENLPVPACLDAGGFETEGTGSPRLWGDYAPGERIEHPSGMTLDESDHTFATRLYQNTAQVHFDALAMRDSQFGRRLVYGGHVISVCRAAAYDGLENTLGIAAINGGSHLNPTFAGDTLYAASEVLERWELPGRSDLGALRLRLTGAKNKRTADLDANDPHRVLELDYTVLIPRKGR